MADKSFGDYTNRNVVKNPLLSSAVTGLSIEDLTHNAVLLPAVPTQELLLRQDQHEHQMQTLRYSDQQSSNIPSGDAKNITTHYNSPVNLNPNPQNTQKYDLTFNTHENPSTTLSKATPKSDDDFDVNEYFARLQGTRYVSAPLNSSLKEDQNANLQTEENLEEINLNEPDKAQNDDVQQSLTADIAQNFSQLPTVLPQVASAVFSSFSNMLNYKSREQTPDDGKVNQEVAPKIEMNMPVVTEVADAAPPPLKEPPSGIASSYRITTKKKVYAQIPGLSSRDNQHIQTFNTPPSNVAPPNYFIPESNVNLPYAENKPENISIGLPPQTSQTEVEMDSQNKNYPKTEKVKSSYNLFNPIPFEEKSKSSDIQAEFFIPSQATEVILPKQEPSLDTANQLIAPGSAPIIPPPPMFSNVRRESQSAVGKSFLPPSVARRISGAHPVVKSQATPNIIPHGNIFIPTIPDPDNSFGTNTTDTQNFIPPTTHSSEPIQTLYDIPVMGKQEMISQNDKQSDISTSLNKLQPTQICDLTPNTMTAFKASTNIPVTNITVGSSGISTDSLFSSHQATSFDATIIPTMTYPVGNEHTRMQLGTSSIFQQPSNSQNIQTQSIHEQPTIAPPLFFSPNDFTQTDIHASMKAQDPITEKLVTEYFSNNAPSEPPKPLLVPPKVTGNQNYRMSKKRPQYYSGPIDGVGSISNNVKPLINPVEPTFAGALFTPDQIVPTATNTMQQDSNICTAQEPAPFDINTPINTGYPMYNTQPELPDNTAFDLSRSTTEQHEQSQQEYKGFGIIGSLKSKLGSLDINKIQSKVTTFFDPAYNATKVEDPIKQESSLYSQHLSGVHYSNYPQNDGTTLEVYVPSIDQGQSVMSTHTYSMEYTQPIDQNQQYNQYNDYFGNQSQNMTNQDTNYYPAWQDYNQQQSSSSYYQNPTNIVQDNSSSIIQEASKNEIVSQIFFDNISSDKTSDKPLINKKQDIPFKVPNVTQPVDVLQFFDQRNVLEKKNEDTISQANTGTELKSFFDQNTHSGFDSIKFQKDEFKQDYKMLSQTEIQSSQSSSIQNIVNNPQAVLKTKNNTGLVTNIPPENFFSDLPKISQDSSSKGFFDKDTPIVLPFEAKKLEENINKRKLREEIEASKIAHPKPVHVLKPTVVRGNSNDFIDYQNKSYINLAQNNDVTSAIKIPDLKDMAIGILPPEALKKEDKVKEYRMFGSEKYTLKDSQNQTSTFSLFEPSPNVASVPLFGLSSMSSISLSPPPESKDIKNIEKKMESISLSENTDSIDFIHNTSKIFGNVGSTDVNKELLEESISDLNICETCREVNKPEDKEVEDLTTQLIENITAPIQLANPVEYPVIEDPLINKNDYEGTFASVPQTEDIIETMNLHPPLDLIDDISSNNAILNYGWSTNEGHSSKVVLEHNYGFQINQGALGFIQDNSLFFETMPTNASDEIKAGYKSSEEDSSILPRQLSIPTAPPEEDTKSDESGLDVHSIEQDATKDFPIYEEFVIEPSETDDGKIEYRERELSLDSPEETVDTFTGRVERYKKMENSSELKDNKFNIKKEFKSFDLPTSTSPAITIASYFDTGNYAVENHYRNSLTSPSTLNSFNTSTNTPMIPPGFEEEYKRRLSQNIPSIYDINKTHTSAKLINIQPQGEDSLCDDTVETMINELIEDAPIEDTPIKTDEISVVASFVETKQETVEDKNEDKLKEPMIKEEHKLESLPDPINFFSCNDDTTQQSDTFNNFSRLSSYFTTPPKPDHSKSFFELSQSQNHYRHKPSENNIDVIQNNVKKFFEKSNLNINPVDSNKNIPQNILHNMSLVNDLTSIENIGPNKDLVITTNYFTVEPSNNIVQEFKITESIKNEIKEELNDHMQNNINARDIDLTICNNIVRSCNRCCHMTEKVKIDNSGVKVRQSMDNYTEHKESSNMEYKKDGAKKSLTVNFFEQTQTMQEDADDKIVVISENRATSEYSPVKHHWFYKVDNEEKSLWRGFSVVDSRALETAYNSPDLNENTLVPTDGGRYDVNVMARLKTAVYWTDKPANVMRCSWFYKGTTDARYVPYTEDIAEKLEEEYRHGITTGEWHRRLMLENNELVVMHGPAVMVHFLQTPVTDTFGSSPFFGKKVYRNPPKIRVCEDQPKRIDHLIFMVHGAGEYSHQKARIQSMMRPRVVRRGCIDSEIEDTEPSSIDHLLLLCHGVGSACDMRFRPVEEVVDDFRATSLQLIQSHYKNSYDNGLVGRVEVLPISWHSSLHSGTGVDKRLAAVTLESIPRLRNFTNDTILDVLFYTSPVFCQTIIDTVCSELNRIYKLFKLRNPDFKGGVSLGGHSLGSVILYDLLCHQLPMDSKSQIKHLIKGKAGTGQPCVEYPRLGFSPDALYALGSPIAIFECIRGVESLGLDFCLPTCKNFFNIFHPYDPIAYRIEPMINPQLRDVKPFLIPHHKGRKRMHLELKETMARVGADIKQKLIESIKNTWSNMWKTQPPPDQHLEKVVEEEMEKEQLTAESKEEDAENKEITPEMLGKLNDGRRIDHVLQEAPFEMINEYLFAMSSHVVYWESEDTMLVMLREIYNAIGVSPDCCLPQNTMTVERHRVHEDPVVTSPESPSTSRGGT